MLGKTNMDEFAMGSSTENSAYFPTHNPWDLDRVPGGSSGGSAAAVAGGEALFALGTDTGGSVRLPAAFCGVVGLKPTYGRVSRYGLVAFASSLDQVGPLTRDVTDAALVLGAIAGHDRRDSTSRGRRGAGLHRRAATRACAGCGWACPGSTSWPGCSPAWRRPSGRALEQLVSLGAEILEEVSLPHTEYALPVYYLIAPAEASANLARYDGVKYGLSAPEAGSLWDAYRHGARRGLRARGQAAHHAGHLCPVGGLLRRLLPEGAEGAHPDQGRLRRRLRPVRRPAGAGLAHGGLPYRRADATIRWPCT